MESFQEIWDNFLTDRLSEAEAIELRRLIENKEPQIPDAIHEMLSDQAFSGLTTEEQGSKILNSIIQKIHEQAAPVRRINWRRWVAAASIVLLIAATVFYFENRKSKIKSRKLEIAKHDIPAPDRSRASITLVDGRVIYLDSVSNGPITNQSDVIVTKSSDGKIVYQKSMDHGPLTMVYNTLTNPRGSKVIDLILSDGSHVWLNSGSSITYPVAFIGNERKVTMTGEAYFEVQHNAKQPFTVSANGVNVHDLGTAFNVNAYSDEPNVRVTLTEGKAQVETISNLPDRQAGLKPQTSNLFPGNQAIIGADIRLEKNADLEEVMAWRNGFFIFSNTQLPLILRQVSRWYDVEIVYRGTGPAGTLSGTLSRMVALSKVIEMLQANGIKAKLEDKLLVIEP